VMWDCFFGLVESYLIILLVMESRLVDQGRKKDKEVNNDI